MGPDLLLPAGLNPRWRRRLAATPAGPPEPAPRRARARPRSRREFLVPPRRGRGRKGWTLPGACRSWTPISAPSSRACPCTTAPGRRPWRSSKTSGGVSSPAASSWARLNSTNDPHYAAARKEPIGPNFYLVSGSPKRLFDRDDVVALFSAGWTLEDATERTTNRYGYEKTLWEIAARKIRGLRTLGDQLSAHD